ncbi:hypothetical protein E4U41_004317 [Claviceps citrina]|nr:hypothetical protein E4U41_004317 [Claviceps citrina]
MRQVRAVPGLRYLQLVLGRDRCCRQMVAVMARSGFLVPRSMHHTLLRLWLLMDIPTTGQRQALLRNTDLWTDEHLYNAQLLFLKLSMMFNDPLYGPFSNELLHVALGQKGLYPLWQLLLQKRFTTLPELLEWKVRYNHPLPAHLYGGGRANEATVHGVPVHEVGTGHFEGWGLGDMHLRRPDELVPVEAVARGLDLDDHLAYMMLWGYVDFETGENVVPSEEDMYLSDEEATLQHMDTTGHWKRKHARKKRFKHLTPLEQRQIMDQDEDDRLRALAWTGDTTEAVAAADGDGGGDHHDDQEPYSLDDEIRRGYIVRPRNDASLPVPRGDDTQGWEAFVNAALATVPGELNEDQALGAQAFGTYHNEDMYGDWDWAAWLAEHEGRRGGAERLSLSSSSPDQYEQQEGHDHDNEEEEEEEEDDEDEEEEDGEEEEEEEEEEEDDDDDDDDALMDQDNDEEQETIILEDLQSSYDHQQVEQQQEEDDDQTDNKALLAPAEAQRRDPLANSLLADASDYFGRVDSDAPLCEPLRRLLEEHAPELLPPPPPPGEEECSSSSAFGA